MLSRRHALLAALVPGVARAQDAAPPIPPVIAPIAPPNPPPQLPPRPPTVATAPAGIDRTKHYYVFFETQIDILTMRNLRRQLTNLVEAGVTEITLVIHSVGGLIDPTLAAYSFIRALPATINTHATGFVASAANLLFLVGEQRSADRNARFLFHPSQFTLSGSVSGQQLHDRLNQYDAAASAMREIYRDRTTLKPEELDRFAQEEVIYTVDQAKAGGIIQTVTDLRIPGDGKSKILILE